MRSLQTEASLTDFIEQAAACLQQEIEGGAEVPFELAAQGSRGQRTPFYSYRPLTNAFIDEHAGLLRGLPTHTVAVGSLVGFEGLDRYLQARGIRAGRHDRRGRAAAALLALLKDVFTQQTDFELRPERLADSLRALDESTQGDAQELTLVATLHGLTIASPELVLTRGLLIARPDALTGAPEEALAAGEGHSGEHLLLVFTGEGEEAGAAHSFSDTQGMLDEGLEVFRELLRALRLFGDGRVSLGTLAWARIGGPGAGAWRTLGLGAGGRPHGMLVVGSDQEDELRAFCNLISRRSPREGELAWALERFEMGCERAEEHQALSDYLLALRVLLEPEGPASGLLAGRLAALCADREGWEGLVARVLQALALEREAIAGTAVRHAAGEALVRDLSDHLRALLRDVICGHLDSDLVAVADQLLLTEEATEETRSPAGFDEVAGDPWETDQLSLAGLPG